MRLTILAKQVSGHFTEFRKDRFFRRLAMLSGSTAAGQLFLVLSTPVLTRLYGPADFGVFAVIVAILAMFNGISSLRLETSIPVCRSEMLPAAIATNFLVIIVTTLLLTVGVIATEIFLPPHKIGSALRESLWVVPVIALFTALTQPFIHLNVRWGSFGIYSMVRMARPVSQGVGQIVFGLIGPVHLGLTLGYGVGPLFSLILLLRHGTRELLTIREVKVHDICAYIREHRRHPFYLAPSSVIYQAVQFLPAALLATIFSPAAAGFFTLSQRVLGLPIRFLSNSASQVLLGEVGEASRSEISRRVKTITWQFTVFGIAIILPMVMIGRSSWEFLFGERWGAAWGFVAVLSPMYILRFVTETVSSMFILTNTQYIRLVSSITLLAITMFSFLMAPSMNIGPLAATAIYSIGCSIVYAAQLLVIRSLSVRYAKPQKPPFQN